MSDGVDVLVVARGVARHVLQFGERLDARVPAADDGEGEQPLAQLRVERRGGRVQPRQHVVAQVDGLTDGLERDAGLGQPGDRQRAGDRAGRDDQHLVAHGRDVAAGELDGDLAVRVVDPHDAAGEVVALLQHLAQRDDDVARLDRTGRRLRQEGLVGHVGLRVDHRDLGLAAAQLLLQPQCGVHPDIAATDDHDPRVARHAFMFPPATVLEPPRAGDAGYPGMDPKRWTNAARAIGRAPPAGVASAGTRPGQRAHQQRPSVRPTGASSIRLPGSARANRVRSHGDSSRSTPATLVACATAPRLTARPAPLPPAGRPRASPASACR